MKWWNVSFLLGAFPEDHPKNSQKREYKMKNQWFGDIHDFRKYGLLRFLSETQQFKRILIAWMLTPSLPNAPAGKYRGFIKHPGQWAKCDPELFNILKESGIKSTRNVKQAFDLGILPRETFVSFGEGDDHYLMDQREDYFQKIKNSDCDLVFLDADNGLEVASMRKSNQSSYIFYREAKALFDAGKSILIYQHRAIGQSFEKQLAQKMKCLPSKHAIVFIGGNVSHILLCRNNEQKKEITEMFCNQKYSKRYLKLQTMGGK